MEPSGIQAGEYSDSQLAVAAAGGNLQAFEIIVKQFSRRLVSFVSQRITCTEDAEDIVQDTFLKAYRYMNSYNPSLNFASWLFKIAYREMLTAIRKQRPSQNLFDEPISGNDLPPHDKIQKKEEFLNLWKSVKQLNGPMQSVLWLRYKQGMSIEQIAKTMSKTNTHVRVLLYRARKSLAMLLRDRECCLSDKRSNQPLNRFEFTPEGGIKNVL